MLPSPEGRPGRYIITFEEYAEIDVPGMAYQWRNPVHYIELSEFGIDPDKLVWKRTAPYTEGEPPSAASSASPRTENRGLDIAEAKKGLSLFYRVPPIRSRSSSVASRKVFDTFRAQPVRATRK